MKDALNLDRRHFLTVGGLAVGNMLMSDRMVYAAQAAVEHDNAQVYRFRIGEWEAWSISDGSSAFPGALNLMAPQQDLEKMKTALAAAYVSADPLDFYFNILVLRRGADLIVFDAGYGAQGAPKTGRLLQNLKRIGADSQEVTHLFLSHAHPDHISGMITSEGKPVFSEAKLIMTKGEQSFWSADRPDFSKSRLPAEQIKGMIQNAQTALTSMKTMIETVDVDTEPVPGIEILDGSGHTAGHAIYRIYSGQEELFHISDLAHNHVLMFANPDWNIAFDTFPSQAVERRKFWFKHLVETRTQVFGYHMPFPGMGHVGSEGGAYRWVPQAWM